LEHLKEALPKSIGDVALDIKDAIKTIDEINPSPLFNSTNIIRHA
jgi:hypothetical protein